MGAAAGSLKVVAKSFKLKNQKQDFDFNAIQNWEDVQKYKEMIEAYNKNDVDILEELHITLCEQIDKLITQGRKDSDLRLREFRYTDFKITLSYFVTHYLQSAYLKSNEIARVFGVHAKIK